jgi:hypothetical protein
MLRLALFNDRANRSLVDIILHNNSLRHSALFDTRWRYLKTSLRIRGSSENSI